MENRRWGPKENPETLRTLPQVRPRVMGRGRDGPTLFTVKRPPAAVIGVGDERQEEDCRRMEAARELAKSAVRQGRPARREIEGAKRHQVLADEADDDLGGTTFDRDRSEKPARRLDPGGIVPAAVPVAAPCPAQPGWRSRGPHRGRRLPEVVAERREKNGERVMSDE